MRCFFFLGVLYICCSGEDNACMNVLQTGAVFFPEEPRFWKSASLRFPMKGRSPGDLFNNAVFFNGNFLWMYSGCPEKQFPESFQ